MDKEKEVVSKKQQVAETLFNMPSNSISNNMIKWILSHLPDENVKGKNETSVSAPGPELKFINSSKKGLHGAFNLSYEDIIVLKDKIESFFPKGEDGNVEKEKGIPRVLILEQLYPQLCDAEKAFLIALGIEPFGSYWQHEKMRKDGKLPEGIEDLLEILKKLRDEMRDKLGDLDKQDEDE